MDNKLEQYIDSYGGKHGGLLYLREQEGGTLHTVPSEILDPTQGLTWEVKRSVQAACKELNTDRVIVRTSERSDWAGMVDTMPTVVSGNSIFSIWMAINSVRRRCENRKLVDYARNEGSEYDPGRVTVSISPYIAPTKVNPRTNVTEHPNNPGVNLVDLSHLFNESQEGSHWVHHAYDYKADGSTAYKYLSTLSEADAKKALESAKWARDTKGLKSDVAYQFEGGIAKDGTPRIFQVREFAPIVMSTFQLPIRFSGLRVFGVTPKEGIELKVNRVENRKDYIAFEKQYPGVDYLLVPDVYRDPLGIEEHFKSMRGFAHGKYPQHSLSHQATRPVKICLSKNGIANLTSMGFERLHSGQTVKIIADGRSIILKDE